MSEDLGSIKYRVIADTNDLSRAESEMDAFGNSANKSAKDVDKLGSETTKMSKSVGGMSSAVAVATRALAAMGVALGAREIIQYADAWQNATNQLKTVQKENENLAATQEKLMAVANASRAGFESTANLYTRLTRSTESLNLSQAETIALTDTINKSFAVSGATAQEASNAITQLSQGLAAGALRGDEFNSVSEQSPILMQAIADSLKMTKGELRDFAGEGGVTAEIVVTALQQASAQIDETFSKMTATFGQNMQVAKNNMLEFVGSAEVVQDVTGKAGEIVVMLSENIDTMAKVAGLAAIAVGGRLVASMGTAAAAAISTTTAVGALNGALALIGGPAGAAALAAFGVYKVVDAYIDHNTEAEKAKTLAFLVEGGFYDLGEEAAAYATKLDTATKSLRQYVAAGGALAGISAQMLQDQADRMAGNDEETETVESAAEAITGYGEKVNITSRLLDAHVQAQEDHIKAMEKARDEAEKQAKTVAEVIAKLEHEQLALQMTDRAQAIFNATTEAYNNKAAPEQIARIAELTAKNYDMAASNTATGKAAEEAAKRAEENWQRTHEYMSDALVDLMDNGGNAFDNIAKSFETMVKRMVAEWAASGLMGMFSGQGLGGFTTDAFKLAVGSGSGGTGSLGTIGTALGSLFGGGASASAVPAANASAAAWGSFYGGSAATGTAAASGGLMSSIGAAATNPVTLAVAALAIAAKNDFWKDPDDYKRSFAGLLTAPTSGAAGSTFAVDPFASGFKAQGIAHGASQQTATQYIDTFRSMDASITALVHSLGGSINMSGATLGGVGMEGQLGSAGTFLGMGGKTTEQDIAGMVNLYVSQMATHITGLDKDLLNAVKSASSAEDAVEMLSEALDKTLGDQAKEMTSMEKAQKSASESILRAYESGITELDSIQLAYRQFRSFAERGLTAAMISKTTGIMESDIRRVLDIGASLNAPAPSAPSNKSSFDPNFDLWAETARQAWQPDAEFRAALEAVGISTDTGSHVNANGNYVPPVDGSHAAGLNRVPFDGYIAQLHEGERVLTKGEVNSMGGGQVMEMLMRRLLSISERWDFDGLPATRAVAGAA